MLPIHTLWSLLWIWPFPNKENSEVACPSNSLVLLFRIFSQCPHPVHHILHCSSVMCSLLSQACLLIHLHNVTDYSCACRRLFLNICQPSWAPLSFRASFHGNRPFFHSKSRSAPLTAGFVSSSHLPDPSYDPLLHVCCNRRQIAPRHIFSCVHGQQILVTMMGSPWPQSVTYRLPQVTSKLYPTSSHWPDSP